MLKPLIARMASPEALLNGCRMHIFIEEAKRPSRRSGTSTGANPIRR